MEKPTISMNSEIIRKALEDLDAVVFDLKEMCKDNDVILQSGFESLEEAGNIYKFLILRQIEWVRGYPHEPHQHDLPDPEEAGS